MQPEREAEAECNGPAAFRRIAAAAVAAPGLIG